MIYNNIRAGKKVSQSLAMNTKQYQLYYDLLLQMAISVFAWQNLPSEIDERFLELTLITRGLSVFWFSLDYDKYFANQACESGHINMYQNPTSYKIYGADGFNYDLKAKECVPIWNSYLRKGDNDIFEIYARRLADIDRTIDVNLLNQKMPVICSIPETKRLTYSNLLKQIYSNEPVIIVDDGVVNLNNIKYISTNVPYICDRLLDAKAQIWSEAMTALGINNNNQQKAERVQTAEVMANNGQIVANRLIHLDSRRKACKAINEKYGLDVWVDYNQDISSINYFRENVIPDDGSDSNDQLTM